MIRQTLSQLSPAERERAQTNRQICMTCPERQWVSLLAVGCKLRPGCDACDAIKLHAGECPQGRWRRA